MKIIQRIASDPDIEPLRAALMSALEVYEATFILNSEAADPPQTVERLKKKIAAEKDPAKRELLASRLNLFSGQGADNLRVAARSTILDAYQPVRDAAIVLLEVAINKALALARAADADEEKLFTAWDFPVQSTAISITVRNIVKELVAALAVEKTHANFRGLPNASHHRVLDMIPAPTL